MRRCPRLVAAVRAAATGDSLIEPAITLRMVTLKTHVARIFVKLGVRDCVEAVELAYETGFAQRSSNERR